ncbi:MAG: hypothetical protein A2W17_04750 [Planctomycetes bacterium RBG_16_41_13]|nr:MAG: hypothetical protein A2W17_04750 [Planctomycetes bacterium RBG_16_41_13]
MLINQNIFGVNAPHIHNLALYGGTCSNLTPIADDELPFVNKADTLAIDLDASGLTVGTTYYIRALRTTSVIGPQCPKVNCTTNGSTTPSTFNLCVENVNVIIPKDFGLELPAMSHAYYQNRGQLVDVNGNPRPDIKLYTANSSPAVYIANDFVSYVYASIDTIATTVDTLHRVDMTLVGANPTRTFKTEKVPDVLNYYLAHIPKGVTGNKGFSRAVQNDVYPNIDMQFYSNNTGIKFYFIVKPGGNADNIVLNFAGANSVNVTASGGLDVVTSLGTLNFDPAHAYQINPAGQIVPMPWQAEFIQLSSTQVKFDIRNYPANMPLFIQVDRGHVYCNTYSSMDNLRWSTFYGAPYHDQINCSATNAAGELFVAGYDESNVFPVTGGQSNTWGDRTATILKFLATGVRTSATYYGGSSNDEALGITVSGNGVTVVGYTGSSDFPPPTNTGVQYAQTYVGGVDGFIIRLTSTGLVWSTLYGLSGLEKFNDVKVIGGNTIIVGMADSSEVMQGQLGAYNQNTTFGQQYGGIILKFNSQDSLIWSTFLGGEATALTANAANFYVTGVVKDNNLPNRNILGGYRDSTLNGNSDAFFAKFTMTDDLTWCTYYGGSSDETGQGIAVDSKGNMYATGFTKSNDLPLKDALGGAYFDNTFNGGNYANTDPMLFKFDSKDLRVWATYYSGASVGKAAIADDEGIDVAIDGHDNVYFMGITYSCYGSSPTAGFDQLAYPPSVFPQWWNGPCSSNFSPQNSETYLAMFTSSLKYTWGSGFGGPFYEDGASISISGNQWLYLVGGSNSMQVNYAVTPQIPVTSVWYKCENAALSTASKDGFICQFNISAAPNGIAELSDNDESLNIYPNPANQQITVEFNSQGSEDIYITAYNNLGQQVFTEKEKSRNPGIKKKNINVNGWSEGMYFIQVKEGSKIISGKLIKIL